MSKETRSAGLALIISMMLVTSAAYASTALKEYLEIQQMTSLTSSVDQAI